MGYITRNANVLLLFLILLSAAGLVGATVYFQARFSAINNEYNSKVTQLENISTQLEQYQGILASTKEELAVKGSREEDLTSKFLDVKGEKESIEAERDRLASDKRTLEVSLADKTAKLTTAQNQVAERDASIATLTSEVNELRGDIILLEEQVDNLDEERDCLKATPDASEGSC